MSFLLIWPQEITELEVAHTLFETEHYALNLANPPRVTDAGVVMHYELFNKHTHVVEGHVQMYPQAVDIVIGLNKATQEILQSSASVVQLVH